MLAEDPVNVTNRSMMKRREFFRNGSLAWLGANLLGSSPALAAWPCHDAAGVLAKNIIFMVSDGMSTGTLNMASLLLRRKEGRQSQWLSLYEEQKVSRALMDMASADSLVTDSAAASSSWGGGVRVSNGSLNVDPDGTFHTPILQKFKTAGKAVGCVTTVQITHATPAGFCVGIAERSDMDEIARLYLPLRFDVMLGGGREHFMAERRRDRQDMINQFERSGYRVIDDRAALMQGSSDDDKPLLGIFCEGSLPYALDHAQDRAAQRNVPTLAEMTRKAIERLSRNKNGFVVQIEGGKVDRAAHTNDAGALLYDQIAFDEAINVAIDFAEEDKETLVVMTTDHGNANPGIFYGAAANRNFDSIQHARHTNDWVLKGIGRNSTVKQIVERIEYAQGWVVGENEAAELVKHFQQLDETGLYNPRRLPFRYLAQIQEPHTSIGWGSMDHSADFVELAMYGPGSELLGPFVKNTDLHDFMLKVAGVAG